MKDALLAPAATVTEAGTVTAVLVDERLTLIPPLGAGALRDTVQASVAAPVMDPLAQANPFNAGTEDAVPVPLRMTAAEVPVELLLLLVMVNWPVTAPAAVGSNVTLKTADCPGFSVSGKVAPETVKPVPVIAGALMVRGRFPTELKVSDFVVVVFTTTLPKATVVALVVRVRVAARSWSEAVLEIAPSVAVRVAVAAVRLVQFTVAVKLAVVAPAATVTEAGTVTAVLLLTRATLDPPVAAATLTATVQTSVVEPVTVVLAQVSPVAWGIPVPVRVMAAVVPLSPLLLLEMVNLPVTAPASVGSNLTVKDVVCPGFSVTGKVVPE